jgi:ABC-type iron transport system FetAB permease component
MRKLLHQYFKLELARDNNYYWGLTLLQLSILSLVAYLIFDAYEPLAFLITFLICGWGFVLLWKSDNDLRFRLAQTKLEELEAKLNYSRMFVVPAHLLKKSKGNH